MTKASRCAGVDPGTMFFQTAEEVDGNIETKIVRNAFVEIKETDDLEEQLQRNGWQYVKDGKSFFVIGEDSIRVANMFPGTELRRPLQDGVLNKSEDKKMLILTEIARSAIGKAPSANSVVATCVSSESVDGSVDSKFHRSRIQGIFKSLGWHVKVIEEAFAIILSEGPTVEEEGESIPYSGIGVSFGAGRVNCVAAYRGMQVQGLGMSAARSGDWVDARVSEAIGESISQVTRVKETKLDFDDIDYDDDIVFALNTYYEEMIKYVFGRFAAQFAKVKPKFEGPVPIVVAGGTTMPKGFCNKLREVIEGLDLPFEVKEVVHASDPREAVVRGCLIQAQITQRKLHKDKQKEIDDALG